MTAENDFCGTAGKVVRRSAAGLCAVLTVGMVFYAGFQVSALAQQASSDRMDRGAGQGVSAQFVSLDGALVAGQVDGRKFADRAALQAFYADRGYAPFWLAGRGLSSKAQALVSALQESWTHGLNPAHYNLGRIERLLQEGTPSALLETDLLLTDALVRYSSDMTGMRVNPGRLNLNAGFHRQPVAAQQILAQVRGAGSMDRFLSALEPQGTLYNKLRKELVALAQDEDRERESVLPLDFGGRAVYPGQAHSGVPALRFRMGLSETPEGSRIYDDRLAAAVIKMQRAQGLEADGVIGPRTLAVLNQSRQGRMEQIVANLERLRWQDQERPDRYAIVNIPSKTLWAVDEGRVAFEMPVIVGKPARRTPEFNTWITGVRFNPSWTVPPTIKRQDMLPGLQEDGDFLSKKGLQLYRAGKSGSLDAAAVDWNNVGSRELSDYRMVMAPGESNPLGRVRIIMPNDYNVYLHDTNHHELFKGDDRALSSGCIRMSEPEKMAAFVLEQNKDWRPDMMKDVLSSYRTREFAAEQKIPVYIVYQTMWLNAGGGLVYGEDLYNRDRQLIEELKRSGYLWIPDYEQSQGVRL